MFRTAGHFFDNRTIVEHRHAQTLGSAPFLTCSGAARPPHLTGKAVLRQRVLTLSQKRQRQGVSLANRFLRGIDEM